MISSDHCLVCWSIERKLEVYLAFGGRKAVDFVMKTLAVCGHSTRRPTTETPPPPPGSEEASAVEEADSQIRKMEVFK